MVDGSIPPELALSISDYERIPYFRVIRLNENQGHGKARRIGCESCSYELVALMDADDISVPNRFERQIQMFQSNPKLDIVGGIIAEFIDSIDNIIGERIVPENND